jgi:hypothetical protein
MSLQKAIPRLIEREYNLKYLGLVGNVYHIKDIEAAVAKCRKLDEQGIALVNNYGTIKAMGIDVGFGSSAFAICIVEVINGELNIAYADE